MIQTYLPMIGRGCLALIFILAGVQKLLHFSSERALLEQGGLPFPTVALGVAIALMLFGGLSVLIGCKPVWGCVGLIVFLIPATLIFHTNGSDPQQIIHLLKNIAILGGLLVVISSYSL